MFEPQPQFAEQREQRVLERHVARVDLEYTAPGGHSGCRYRFVGVRRGQHFVVLGSGEGAAAVG
jgi:hypothetical protein